jgi:hypothetical protein
MSLICSALLTDTIGFGYPCPLGATGSMTVHDHNYFR